VDFTTLAVANASQTADLRSLVIVVAVAALVPIVVGLLNLRIAEVVFLLGFGILVGPHVLGLIHITDTIDLFNELGLGLLFFLAGYELDPVAIRGESGKLAITGWLTSIALSLGITWIMWHSGYIHDFLGVVIAFTSTALGTLLPMIRDRGQLHTPFGRLFLGAGAAGEFGPILAIALLLGAQSTVVEIALLIVFALVAIMLYFAPGFLATEKILAIIERGHKTSSQTAVRSTMLLILGLLFVSTVMGFDAVLGAFVAGLIVRRYAPEHLENKLIPKIEAIGFGFFIPLFFVVSGANLDVQSIIANPLRLLLFFVLLFVIRGLPQYVLYRGVLPSDPERARFSLYVATALPILVAITSLELRDGVMLPETAAALVGAGALSVLVFPLLGDRLAANGASSPTQARAELLDEQH
jgi:Kef-type K+ transport system membrane component KefB